MDTKKHRKAVMAIVAAVIIYRNAKESYRTTSHYLVYVFARPLLLLGFALLVFILMLTIANGD